MKIVRFFIFSKDIAPLSLLKGLCCIFTVLLCIAICERLSYAEFIVTGEEPIRFVNSHGGVELSDCSRPEEKNCFLDADINSEGFVYIGFWWRFSVPKITRLNSCNETSCPSYRLETYYPNGEFENAIGCVNGVGNMHVEPISTDIANVCCSHSFRIGPANPDGSFVDAVVGTWEAKLFSVDRNGQSTLIVTRNFAVGNPLEIIDPDPDFLDENGEVINDPELLATGGNGMTEAFADSDCDDSVLLRYFVGSPGKVEFCIENGFTPEDGSFSGGFFPKQQCITADIVETEAGGFMAFAVYKTPGQDNPADKIDKRHITFKALFNSKDGVEKVTRKNFTLLPSLIEIIDPNPRLLDENGKIINDLNVSNRKMLAKGGEERVGAATDGVTELLLRVQVCGPGNVDFWIEGASDKGEDGLLTQLGDESDGKAKIENVPVHEIVEIEGFEPTKKYFSFIRYRVPDVFSEAPSDDIEREVKIRACWSEKGGLKQDIEFKPKEEMFLCRPPVVLVHGTWSSKAIWTFPLIWDDRFSVTYADYSINHNNAKHFSKNILAPQRAIREAIKECNKDNIAATQVDIVGHSLGGILCRNYIGSNSEYKNKRNFLKGDIHKLITLNTPHLGMPPAEAINFIRANGGTLDPDGIGKTNSFEDIAADKKIDQPLHLGVVDDFVPGSNAYNNMVTTEVPCHAIYGVYSDFIWPPALVALYVAMEYYIDWHTDYDGPEIEYSRDFIGANLHDVFVPKMSQIGGIGKDASTLLIGGDTDHLSCTNELRFSDKIIELLNAPSDSPKFSHFPAPSSNPLIYETPFKKEVSFRETGRTSRRMQKVNNASDSAVTKIESLVVSSPSDGLNVSPGQVVQVSVIPPDGVNVDSVLLVAPGYADVDDFQPFEFKVTIPKDQLGNFEISSVGANSRGEEFISNNLILQVSTNALLDSIKTIPDSVILFYNGDIKQVIVLGEFDGGALINITKPDLGIVTYRTSNPDIATVSPDGVITAQGEGDAELIVEATDSSGLPVELNVPVTVLENKLVADAGGNQGRTTAVGQEATLNGVNSFDRVNGPEPLSYKWTQVQGPTVSLSDDTAPKPTFTPEEEGFYEFQLIVSDSINESVPDSASIKVENMTTDELGAISGRVVNTNNQPIEGLIVDAFVFGGFSWVKSDSTDSDGNYFISKIPPGSYMIQVGLETAYVRELYDNVTAWESATSVIVDANNVTTNIDFALENAGTLSGTIVDINGNGVEGVAIDVFDFTEGSWITKGYTDGNGNYTIKGIPGGTYRVKAIASTLGQGFEDEYYDNVPDWNDATPVTVEAQNDTANIDFVLGDSPVGPTQTETPTSTQTETPTPTPTPTSIQTETPTPTETPTVTPPPIITPTPTGVITDAILKTISSSVTNGSDDVEERQDGSILFNSSDIELTEDGANNQTIGMIFRDINVPQGATITNAYIQLTTDEVSSGLCNLEIRGEAVDNPADFADSANNISSRLTTTETVNWSPADWNTVGESGELQKTPDIKAVIQEIVNRAGWNANNSISIIVTGSGRRTAESFEGSSTNAAKLVVEYELNPEPVASKISSSVTNGSDDVEERQDGSILFNSSDIELNVIKLRNQHCRPALFFFLIHHGLHC